jgi:spore coat protein U-like protein
MRTLRIALLGSAVIGSLVAVGGADATTTTATMSNSATLTAYCTVSTGNLAFGSYNGSATVSTTANVAVTCTNTTTYSVALDAGTTSGGTTAVRKLTAGGADTIDYTISQDAGHSTNWATGGSAQAGTGNGASQTLVAYGNIAAGQLVTPGSYTDTVTVTLTY